MEKILAARRGFTLLEMIIVVIIIGVLASLALPRLFKTIEFSRSTEALNSLGEVRRALDRCSMMSGVSNYQGCNTFNAIGMEDPGTVANAHFTYNIATLGTLKATRNTIDGGLTTDSITFTLNTGTGAVTKAGTGNFAGIR